MYHSSQAAGTQYRGMANFFVLPLLLKCLLQLNPIMPGFYIMDAAPTWMHSQTCKISTGLIEELVWWCCSELLRWALVSKHWMPGRLFCWWGYRGFPVDGGHNGPLEAGSTTPFSRMRDWWGARTHLTLPPPANCQLLAPHVWQHSVKAAVWSGP